MSQESHKQRKPLLDQSIRHECLNERGTVCQLQGNQIKICVCLFKNLLNTFIRKQFWPSITVWQNYCRFLHTLLNSVNVNYSYTVAQGGSNSAWIWVSEIKKKLAVHKIPSNLDIHIALHTPIFSEFILVISLWDPTVVVLSILPSRGWRLRDTTV